MPVGSCPGGAQGKPIAPISNLVRCPNGMIVVANPRPSGGGKK